MKRSALIPALTVALVLTGCGYNPFESDDMEGNGELRGIDVEDPPAFGEIRDDVFTAMLGAESVTISGEVRAGDADLDELFDDIEEDTTGTLEISGALDGRESEMSFSAGGSRFTQRAVNGGEYFQGEDFAELLVGEFDDDFADAVDADFISTVVADQWVQLDEGEQAGVFSAEEFITTWRDELESEDVASMRAETEEHDGQPVWVYTADGGESEFVVAADENPYLLTVEDEDSRYEFTEWSNAELPEVPESIITLDEIFDAVAEDQGWTTENPQGESPEREVT